jgi:hypothetical protein
MRFYDIFNGDADGICALHQLRLAEPRSAVLITGVKRDIALLDRVTVAPGDELTVFDVSLDRNRDALLRALNDGARVQWFDHHFPGTIPRHPALQTFIDPAADVCTSLIVDRHLGGRYRAWAVVAAFGDNLGAAARRAAQSLKLTEDALHRLQELGECLNYNAYGESVDDLHYHPADLYATLAHYPDPFDFIVDEPVFDVLHTACADDLALAASVTPAFQTGNCVSFVLPAAAWSRRISGLFANRLAHDHPARAHAVMTLGAGGYVVSVRAPVSRPEGADELCRKFGGGGRKAAGGIDFLQEADVDRFYTEFQKIYS